MSLRPRFVRICCSRLIPGLLLALALSSTAFSQQIPCPVTTTYTNSSATATNSVNPCNINASFTNNPGATLQNQPGGTIIDNGTITNNGTLNDNGSIGLAYNPTGGDLTIASGGTFINNGTVNNNSGFPGGVLTINSGGTFTNNSGAVLNNDFYMYQNGTLNNSGTINNGFTSDGVTNNYGLYDGGLTEAGTFNNYGTFINNAGLINILPGGTLNNLSGSTYSQTTGYTTVFGTLNSVPSLQIQGGTLAGIGTINGNVTLTGTLAPGTYGPSVGTLTINGNYMQTDASTFAAQIEGLTAGTDYDQLFVNGAASLEGTLDVYFTNFTPGLGDSFILMMYGSETGMFSTLDLPGLPRSEDWLLSYNTDDLTLSVGSTGLPAPEPSTLLLLAAGVVMLLGFRRKKGAMLRT